jgi:hypothetical protein
MDSLCLVAPCKNCQEGNKRPGRKHWADKRVCKEKSGNANFGIYTGHL